jgi:protein-tyrosine-phosphatase
MTPRSFARLLKNAPDRLLHRMRRQRAHEQVAQLGFPGSVLFICLGNINRSAYAAAVFQRAAAQRGSRGIRVRSAGFIGPGRPSPPEARRAALARGIDLSSHTSRAIEAAELATTSLIVVMDSAQRRRIIDILPDSEKRVVVLGDFDPAPIERRAVTDPYGRSDDVFESVFQRIERCVDRLATTALGRSR